MVASLEQTRQLVTEIPGPASLELTKRRAAAVSHAVNVSVPVFVARAGGGIIEDVDGNRLIDLGSGIAVTTIGNSSPRVVEAVRVFNIRYILTSEPSVRGFAVPEGLRSLEKSKSWAKIYDNAGASGGAQIWEWRGNAAATHS